MEPTAPVTRRRRKRVHSTKCPCCSAEDGGKPEKATRTRRREDNVLQPAGSSKLENERSPKNVQDVKINGPKLNEVNKVSSELDNGEDSTSKEGRVLRSGRSTPVVAEVEQDKDEGICQSKKSNKVVKKKLFTKQKGRKHTTLKNKRKEKSTGNGFKPISEKHFDTSNGQDTVGGKVKISKKKNKVGSLKQQVICPIPSQGSSSSDQPGNVLERNKRKTPSGSNKQTTTKRAKTAAVQKPVTKRKNVADERLKIRAFDQLKEKLEIAFSQSPLTVPECVDLLQSITLPNLKEIFESPATPVVGERAAKGFKSSLSDETTESGSETRLQEKEIIKKMNESEAAEALVSFKVQTSAASSNSSQCHDQISLPSQQPSNSKEHTSMSSQVPSSSSFHNVNTFTTSSSVGLTPLSFPNQPFRNLEVPAAAATTSMVNPPTLPGSVPRVQTPVTFQLLQVPNQGTSPTLPGDLASAHLQQNPGFLYQNSGTTMMNKLAPTPLSQQPNTVFSPAMNQFVYLKLKQQHEQKFTSFLPGIQAQEQALPKSSFPSVSHPITCTSVANPTVSMSTPASTSTPEILLGTKLRPILPREPLVSPNFSLFNQSYQQSSGGSALPKLADKSSDVKQAVKRLLNERTKTSDNTAPEVMTSLPDIASTFRKSSCTMTSSFDSHERNLLPTFKQEQQDCTEMASKEQAIKALLSIGGNESLSQRGSVERDGLGNRPYETNRTNELKVVFDTDKGIFKVDDVTIDPQVNTIGKESYTCAKCGKIFTSLSYLARHIKRVCPDMSRRKWKCSQCEKAFRHPFGLQQHVYTHTGERPHKCPQCPKAFYSSNDLRRHSRIHSGERPYKCKHCGKNFATTISLKTHTFIHTGEKPHRCPHCPKTFATSSKLGRHIVTHSEQRPYSCLQCPKTFNRSGDLRRHNLHVHHGKLTENAASGLYEEKIYKCTECNNSFDTSKELEAHISEHTTENGMDIF